MTKVEVEEGDAVATTIALQRMFFQNWIVLSKLKRAIAWWCSLYQEE
jgi:hypothetical protein